MERRLCGVFYMSKIAEAARRYTENGAAVYPARPDKTALIRGWNGRAAARDPERAAAYFTEFPDAQLGLACGPSNLVVIDVDPRNGGDASFRRLCAEIGLEQFESCPVVSTPGGRHIYFRAPTPRLRSASHALGPGVDIIGDRGGVLAPPSRRGEGDYAWVTPNGELPALETLPEMPAAIVERVVTRAMCRTTRQLAGRLGSRIAEGQRNDTLARIASKLRWRLDLSGSELLAALIALNERCAPPLPHDEVRMIAESIAARAAAAIDPIAWLSAWLPSLSKEREVRVASALAALADFSTGPLSPSGFLIEQRTGMPREKYYLGRKGLRERGAIRVIERGKLAPIIELLAPPASADPGTGSTDGARSALLDPAEASS
jgi:hypothetical protein